MFGFDHEAVKGLNYSYAATQIPAFDYQKLPDGEVKRTWLDAGTNPPDGAIVFYTLPEDAQGEVTLTFLDDAGTVLRTVKSKKEEEEKPDDQEFPPKAEDKEEKDDDPYVPAKKGLNRFVWDLRLTQATKIASKGGDQPDRTGPRVVPGNYQVRLEVKGEERTAWFRLVADPRPSTSLADLECQFDLL